MTLPFSTTINGAPNYFVDKIWCGLIQFRLSGSKDLIEYQNKHFNKFQSTWDVTDKTFPAKIHTIRRDLLNRWKPGNKIHMVTGNRTKTRFQFAPMLEVLSDQVIMISRQGSDTIVTIDGKVIGRLFDGLHGDSQLKQLAINDGFENEVEFCEYFKHDFLGKIIHWRPLKY